MEIITAISPSHLSPCSRKRLQSMIVLAPPPLRRLCSWPSLSAATAGRRRSAGAADARAGWFGLSSLLSPLFSPAERSRISPHRPIVRRSAAGPCPPQRPPAPPPRSISRATAPRIRWAGAGWAGWGPAQREHPREGGRGRGRGRAKANGGTRGRRRRRKRACVCACVCARAAFGRAFPPHAHARTPLTHTHKHPRPVPPLCPPSPPLSPPSSDLLPLPLPAPCPLLRSPSPPSVSPPSPLSTMQWRGPTGRGEAPPAHMRGGAGRADAGARERRRETRCAELRGQGPLLSRLRQAPGSPPLRSLRHACIWLDPTPR